jgi:penicillin-binding protein 2
VKIVESDAKGNRKEGGIISNPVHGEKVELSIDADLQRKMYEIIKGLAEDKGFKGGAGMMMDLETGELIVAVNYPDYDAKALLYGDRDIINALNEDPKNPVLNRISSGLFTPGSIVKPFMAIGALEEGVITPYTEIVSTGKLVVPNRYNPDLPSIFTDWKVHGSVNVRRALAVSSNIFFYQIGGGFGAQKGIGINNINKYMKLFGFGIPLEKDYFGDEAGIIPNPEWKQKNFDDDWRLGDTYFTSIGQYGFQITPLQALRAVSGIAVGKLVEPTLLHGDIPITKDLPGVTEANLQIVREGMRQGVLDGTVKGLNIDSLHVAAKTGTAELGVSKANVNSWTMGFFPYEKPKYAFVVMMQEGDVHNLIGGVYVSRNFLDYLRVYRSEYLD